MTLLRKILSRALLLSVAVIVHACGQENDIARYPTGPGSFRETGDYSFAPKTIIASIDRGNKNLFTPILATPDPASPLPLSGSFSLHQTDYERIASALYDYVWQDTLEGWQLYEMGFNKTDCQNPLGGFDYADFIFFKADGSNEYTARAISIYPQVGEVSWGGQTNFPRPFLFGWKSVMSTAPKTSADDALVKAEGLGGEGARLAAKGMCRISVLWAPNTDYDSWDVKYYDGGSIAFQVLIDPNTGADRIIQNNR
jgi:hypothetical protein